jgi:hypothetical protein
MPRPRGHGTIINMSSYSPFIFTYNPTEIETHKKIHYAIAPNIGGASKRRYFSGFDSKEVTFKLTCIDMESPTGVMDEIAYFEALREPDPGIMGGWGMSYGNENYPPPQVLFQFGISYLPLVWDVLGVSIHESYFYAGSVRGVLGIPKKIDISIHLALDENHPMNLANQVAKKADMYAGSVKSIAHEAFHKMKGSRKEMPGMFSKSGMLMDRRISLRY